MCKSCKQLAPERSKEEIYNQQQPADDSYIETIQAAPTSAILHQNGNQQVIQHHKTITIEAAPTTHNITSPKLNAPLNQENLMENQVNSQCSATTNNDSPAKHVPKGRYSYNLPIDVYRKQHNNTKHQSRSRNNPDNHSKSYGNTRDTLDMQTKSHMGEREQTLSKWEQELNQKHKELQQRERIMRKKELETSEKIKQNAELVTMVSELEVKINTLKDQNKLLKTKLLISEDVSSKTDLPTDHLSNQTNDALNLRMQSLENDMMKLRLSHLEEKVQKGVPSHTTDDKKHLKTMRAQIKTLSSTLNDTITTNNKHKRMGTYLQNNTHVHSLTFTYNSLAFVV